MPPPVSSWICRYQTSCFGPPAGAAPRLFNHAGGQILAGRRFEPGEPYDGLLADGYRVRSTQSTRAGTWSRSYKRSTPRPRRLADLAARLAEQTQPPPGQPALQSRYSGRAAVAASENRGDSSSRRCGPARRSVHDAPAAGRGSGRSPSGGAPDVGAVLPGVGTAWQSSGRSLPKVVIKRETALRE